MALESSCLSIRIYTLAEVVPWKSSLIDNSPQLCVPSGRSCAATKSCFVYWTRWDCAQSSFEVGRVGIRHYQAVVTLPTRAPFLGDAHTHNSSSNLGESTATAEIVKEWAQLIIDYRQDTTMCMDNYYLSGAVRGVLRDLNMGYIAALKPDRFARIVNFLSPHVQNTGDSAWAWNNERNEAAVYHSSRGKKFTLSNCFSLRRVRQPREYVPIYDEYRSTQRTSLGVYKFNQLLHNKTIPCRLPKDTNLAEAKNI